MDVSVHLSYFEHCVENAKYWTTEIATLAVYESKTY